MGNIGNESNREDYPHQTNSTIYDHAANINTFTYFSYKVAIIYVHLNLGYKFDTS